MAIFINHLSGKGKIMWTRKELKEKAKLAFKRNYWKCVLVALIMGLIMGGVSGSSSFRSGYQAGQDSSEVVNDLTESLTGGTGSVAGLDIDEVFEDIFSDVPSEWLVGFAIGFCVVLLIAILFSVAISVFLLNPLYLGCQRFFMTNHYEESKLSELGFSFGSHYGNCIKTLFLRDLYTFLWGLLFVIPGIIKSYEYRMIPYILADNPDMDTNQVFAMSKEMMTGQKWNAFVLDLSFILWKLLSLITLGIVGLFYVNPYVYATDAELYHALKGSDSTYVSGEVIIE